MDLSVTLALIAMVVAAGALSGWRGAQPPNLQRGPRLVPWRFLMVLCGALLLYLAVHLLSLMGLMGAPSLP
jgi:hypothetical protein